MRFIDTIHEEVDTFPYSFLISFFVIEMVFITVTVIYNIYYI